MIPVTHGPERRYGKALYELAREKKAEKKITEQVETLRTFLSTSHELRQFLASPLVSLGDKRSLMEGILKKTGASELLTRFVFLVIKKGRASLLETMLYWYRYYDMRARGIVDARVVTASPLAEKQKAEISAFVQKQVPEAKGVVLEEEIHADLLGGFKVIVGSQEFDATVRGKLSRLGTALRGLIR